VKKDVRKTVIFQTATMVSLSQVKASNALISCSFPSGLVALFVGATSGIGETTLKKFAQYSQKPRAYFVGRSQDAADRIVAECKKLNSGGEYIFIKADVSLIRVVDAVCKDIKAKEKSLNILFLSQGVMSMGRSGMINLNPTCGALPRARTYHAIGENKCRVSKTYNLLCSVVSPTLRHSFTAPNLEIF
jgi:hypothetical protein